MNERGTGMRSARNAQRLRARKKGREARKPLALASHQITPPLFLLLAGDKPLVHGIVGRELKRVVERLERGVAIAALERAPNEIVGHAGILGQQRPMDVGAHDVFVQAALVAALAVVAVAMDDAPERLHALSQVRAAAVILIAHDGLCRDAALDGDVSDKARVAAIRIQVNEREALDLLVSHEVGVAKQLVAAADGRKHAAILDVGRELRALGEQVLAHDALLAVRATADEDDVHVREARAVIDVDLPDLAADAAPLQALPQHEDVAAVSVEVQQLRVEMRDAQGPLAHRRSPIFSSSALAGHSAE